MKITLTFDNGPEPEVTDHVLDVLGAERVRSTFFVIGEKLADGDPFGIAAGDLTAVLLAEKLVAKIFRVVEFVGTA